VIVKKVIANFFVWQSLFFVKTVLKVMALMSFSLRSIIATFDSYST
jgi:hypothetical protein